MQKLTTFFTATLLLLLVSTPSFALTMDQAKNQGLIGETNTGYLASVKSNPIVEALVSSINQKRKAAFISKAAKAGVSVDVIAKRVAQRLYQKAAVGNYLQSTAGKWYKK